MSRRDVQAEMLSALDAFVGRGAELPATSDGKVNVAALCRELGLRPSDAQHLFRKEAVKTAINALAEDQGLAHIGARAERDASDEVLRDGMARVATQARKDAQAAAEQSVAASVLLDELVLAQTEVERFRLENESLRFRLQLYEEGGVAPSLR